MLCSIVFMVIMSSLSLSIAAPVSTSSYASPSKIPCSSYTINGPSPRTFRHHQVHDFRAIGNPSTYLTSPDFTSHWSAQSWSRSSSPGHPLGVTNKKENILIEHESDYPSSPATHLTLLTSRPTTSNVQTAAELETVEKTILHASIRVRARVSGDPGAVAAIFTYADDTNEADIEILTKDGMDMLHYTNQPGRLPGATQQTKVRNGQKLGDWADHRIDWLEGRVEYYLDNRLVSWNKVNVPDKGSVVDINMWGDGGKWSGLMKEGGKARMEVQWVQIAYNTTFEGTTTGHLETGRRCTVDGGQQVGMIIA